MDSMVCLVPPSDPKALADEVSFLLSNPDYATKLGENGRKVVETRFSFQVVGKQCKEIYKEVVQKFSK